MEMLKRGQVFSMIPSEKPVLRSYEVGKKGINKVHHYVAFGASLASKKENEIHNKDGKYTLIRVDYLRLTSDKKNDYSKFPLYSKEFLNLGKIEKPERPYVF